MAEELPLIDPAAYDFANPVIGMDEIRKYNPQRFEFEMLSGIVHLDKSQHLVVGFKDVLDSDFWVRGHMPGFPLFPGVLMCEAAAQLCAYYYTAHAICDPGVLLGLAGVDGARFVRAVKPGERLILVGKGVRIHRRLTRFQVVGQVGAEKAFEVLVSGTPLGRLEELRGA